MTSLTNAGEEDELKRNIKLFKGLIVNEKKTDASSKQERAEAIEEMFKTIMAFDINRFDFKSYKDIISDARRFEDCYAITHLAQEAVNYIKDYRKLRMDEEVNTRLRDVHVEEIHARCDMLMSAFQFFDTDFARLMASDQVTKTGMSIDDILHLTQTEIDRNYEAASKSGDPDLLGFWISVKQVTNALEGFDIQVPMSNLERRFRAKHNLLEKSRATEVYNILSETKSVFAGIEVLGTKTDDVKVGELKISVMSEEALKAQFASEFAEKDYTVSERESKLYNRKSRLYKKRLASEKMLEKSNGIKDEILSACKGITLENRIAVGEKNLKLLGAFFDGNTDEDNELVRLYISKEGRTDALDILTCQIMEMDLDVDVSSDEDFAKNADRLEEISKKAIAYDALRKQNPEYAKRLMKRMPGCDKSDLERVVERLDRMFSISDYYRARRMLLTDPYYVLHYNDEISANTDSAATDEQKRVADLIKLVADCTKRLEGREYRSRDDALIDSVLDHQEALSRQSAYLIGRPDLTKIDPSDVNSAHEEIRRYFRHAGIDDPASSKAQKNIVAATDEEKPYPEAERYKTKSAKNYFDMHKIDIKNKLIGHKTEKLFEKAVEALENDPQKTFTDKVIFVVNNIIDQLEENQALLLFISKNLSWGIFKNLIDSGEKGTEQGIAATYEKIMSEEGDNIESPEIMFYMICEFVSSVSYSPILYKEPVLIDDLKPHIFRTIRSIIAQYQKVPDKTE